MKLNGVGMLLIGCLLALLSTPEAHMIIERPAVRLTPEEYRYQRARLATREAKQAFGADIVLTTNETIVNNHLIDMKVDELNVGYIDPYNFAPARHFFEVLDLINASPLFQFIREMPKGAVLHAHDTALASTGVIVNATYFPNLWQRGTFADRHDLEFRFSRAQPTTGDGWELVDSIRNRTGADRYDEEIRRLFSLYDADPLHAYRSINDVWTRFSQIFLALEPIVTYKPVWEHYFREALREFKEDNVMYLEFRGLLPTLYDLDGNTYKPEDVVEIYRTITEEFKATNPRFIGTKFIYAPMRLVDNQTMDQYLSLAKRLHHQYGDYVVGFDLVGQEDIGRQLFDFVPQLLNLPSSINFVFHAGETNWHGMPSDENLFDAILLGTKRIGHGYALLKHPVLLDMVKQRDICVEINPVSNQVLKLVADYRNHPGSILFATNFPLVVSSDDPSFWGAAPLSHDFYMAFLGMTTAYQDLRVLKKLALNSLRYSLMSKQDKAAAEAIFHQSWDDFINAKVGQLQMARPSYDEYCRLREEFFNREQARGLGADLVLSEDEQRLNRYVMHLKQQELAKGVENPYELVSARHFFEMLERINESPLFKVIQQMPKGGVLHAHDTAIGSTELIVRATHHEHLWQSGNIPQTDSDPMPVYKFSRTKPTAEGDWRLVADIRSSIGNEAYDEAIRKMFTLYTKDPLNAHRDINDVWRKFMALFICFEPMVTYRPVWEEYFYGCLEELLADNVTYLEFRGLLPPVYDLDDRTYSPEDIVQMYVDQSEKFLLANPKFMGVKFIYAPLKFCDDRTFDGYLDLVQKLKERFPHFIAGFDLVGQEDLGRPHTDFNERLLRLPPAINFFFHAGETNWAGRRDENLIDAILLGTKRIGHGFAALKHPVVLEQIKQRQVCIELNPISNQVLKLVQDFRNHPGAFYFSDNYPVVVSSDDPSFWCASPLSHDFFVAFMGLASARADIRLLKKLALNSIEYSSMDADEKVSAVQKWTTAWDKFVEETLKTIPAEF
uniref:Adenosine deaminase n=1 Tax=Anopheles minimus TaxID=112268 RepID=A0A182WBF6_9DIPT